MNAISREISTALDRLFYGGTIGISYSTPTGRFFAIVAVSIITLLALIGLITVLRLTFFRKRKPKETPGEKWLRTGKM